MEPGRLSRRQVLMGLAAGGALGTGERVVASSDQGGQTVESLQSSSRLLGDPVGRPHVLAWGGNSYARAGKGYEPSTAVERAETLQSMHADEYWSTRIIGFLGPPRDVHLGGGDALSNLEMGLRLGYGPVLGRMGEFGTTREDDWYTSLPTERKWRWPDGSLVESHKEAATRHVDGRPVHIDDRLSGEAYTFEASKHLSGVREFFSDMAVDIASTGARGVWIDGGTNWGNRDYSAWAEANLREHLQSFSASELNAMDIQDPSSLDLVDELTSRTPRGEHPATDSLYREFIKEDYRAIREYFASVRESLESAYPDRDDLVLFSNQADFQSVPELVALTAAPLEFAGMEAQKTIPPDIITDFVVKFALAAGGFEKSGFQMGSFLTSERGQDAIRESGLDLKQVQADLLGIEFAEQIANRGIGAMHYHGDCCVGSIDEQPGNWVAPDGNVPDQLQTLAGFARYLEPVLRGGRFAHDVAVVLSVPTLMWERADYWGIENDRFVGSFQGAASMVRDAGHPYDVLVFGHPDIEDEFGSLERLHAYDQVVLPAVTCLSDDQRTALREFLDAGGSVLVVDDEPLRNADYQPLPGSELASVLEHANTTRLPGTAARDYWEQIETSDGGVVGDALNESRLRLDTTRPHGVTVQTRPGDEPERLVVQVVNYDLNIATGDVKPLTNTTVTITDPDIEVSHARYYKPGTAPEDLSVEPTDGGVSITLPEVGVWGVLVIGASASEVSLPGDESSASEAVTIADEAIAAAKTEGRTVGLPVAERLREWASEARTYGAHTQVHKFATRATQAAEDARRPAVVGIDTGHGQPGSTYDYGFFEEFRGFFDRTSGVKFEEVTTWDGATFEELDVLIVPPTLDFEEPPKYGFTATDGDRLEQFVRNGGSVFFLAQANTAPDLPIATEPLGFTFEQEPVWVPDDNEEGGLSSPWYLRRGEIHTTNQAIFRLGAVGQAAVLYPPDDATILYRVADSPGAFLDVGSTHRTRDDGDKPAGGLPVSAIWDHGDGTVFAFGDTTGFREMTDRYHTAAAALRYAIEHLATQATNPSTSTNTSSTTTSTSNSTTNSAPTTSPSSPTSDTTTGDTPGFTALTTLTGLGLATYRLLTRDRD